MGLQPSRSGGPRWRASCETRRRSRQCARSDGASTPTRLMHRRRCRAGTRAREASRPQNLSINFRCFRMGEPVGGRAFPGHTSITTYLNSKQELIHEPCKSIEEHRIGKHRQNSGVKFQFLTVARLHVSPRRTAGHTHAVCTVLDSIALCIVYSQSSRCPFLHCPCVHACITVFYIGVCMDYVCMYTWTSTSMSRTYVPTYLLYVGVSPVLYVCTSMYCMYVKYICTPM